MKSINLKSYLESFKLHKDDGTYPSNGTHSMSQYFDATVNELKDILGEPDQYFRNCDEEKVQTSWCMERKGLFGNEHNNYSIFTVYDWKEYRKYTNDEMISWHIGGFDRAVAFVARLSIEEKLKELRNK